MKKTLTMILAFALVFALGVGGTLAWLTDKTDVVTNTFTTSDIEVTIAETLPENKTAQMVPGHTIAKDPSVKITEGSEEAYLFIKITENNDFATYMTYEVADSWTAVPDNAGYYYMIIDAESKMGVDYPILKDNTVTVKPEVTKAQMEAIEEGAEPTLTFQASAVQYYATNGKAFSVADAFAKAQWN